jgi:hypothetical protein
MGKKVRVRCPTCGMLVWQSRLNKDFPLEFILQDSSGAGYQKIRHSYKPLRIPDSEGGRLFCAMLALKMAEKAKRILKRVGADKIIEIDIKVWDEDDEETIDEEEYIDDREYDYEEEEPGLTKEYEPETQTFEFEFDDEEYEIDVPIQVAGEVKKRSLLGRLFSRSDGKLIKEMSEEAPPLEWVFDSYDVEHEEVR